MWYVVCCIAAAQQNQLHLMSCGTDKSVMFRTLITVRQQNSDMVTLCFHVQTMSAFFCQASDPKFAMSHHVSAKSTLYDMKIDATGYWTLPLPDCVQNCELFFVAYRKYVAVACQDRKVR